MKVSFLFTFLYRKIKTKQESRVPLKRGNARFALRGSSHAKQMFGSGKMSPLLLRINLQSITFGRSESFRKISKKTFLVESFYYIIATQSVRNLTKRRTLTSVFSRQIFGNGWAAPSAQSEMVVCVM